MLDKGTEFRYTDCVEIDWRNSMLTLWKHNWNFTSAALYVNIKKETEKAIQFEAADNPKYTFWLPKKAVKFEEIEGSPMATIARWCTPGEWYFKAADRYANYYKR